MLSRCVELPSMVDMNDIALHLNKLSFNEPRRSFCFPSLKLPHKDKFPIEFTRALRFCFSEDQRQTDDTLSVLHSVLSCTIPLCHLLLLKHNARP